MILSLQMEKVFICTIAFLLNHDLGMSPFHRKQFAPSFALYWLQVLNSSQPLNLANILVSIIFRSDINVLA